MRYHDHGPISYNHVGDELILRSHLSCAHARPCTLCRLHTKSNIPTSQEMHKTISQISVWMHMQLYVLTPAKKERKKERKRERKRKKERKREHKQKAKEWEWKKGSGMENVSKEIDMCKHTYIHCFFFLYSDIYLLIDLFCGYFH